MEQEIVGGSRLTLEQTVRLATRIWRRGPYYYYPDGMMTSYPRKDIPEEWWEDDDQVADRVKEDT